MAGAADLHPRTVAAFEQRARLIERRLDREKHGERPFLQIDDLPPLSRTDAYGALARGGAVVGRMEGEDGSSSPDVPDGLCHHWVGTVFIPGATLDRVIRLMQSYDRYADVYAPNIRRARLIDREGNHFKVSLQLFMKKVVSVVLNTNYEVEYVPVSSTRMQVRSASSRIAEVDAPDTAEEREKPIGHDSGFLWRFNNYCVLEERPLRAGEPGTFVQCETLSLSRAIPLGVNWLVGPFVSSVPRESLELTLSAMRTALTSRVHAAAPARQLDEPANAARAVARSITNEARPVAIPTVSSSIAIDACASPMSIAARTNAAESARSAARIQRAAPTGGISSGFCRTRNHP
jgi:hypothetical protein